MKERPIIFSAPMVRAILDGRKTMTRRVVKPQPFVEKNRGGEPFLMWQYSKIRGHGVKFADGRIAPSEKWFKHCPYGQPGDLLWVRETFAAIPEQRAACYRATESGMHSGPWTPSIHMPRWASRITLRITDVRVERLQDISESDAKAEGAMYHDGRGVGHSGWRHDYSDVFDSATSSFSHLWGLITANPERSWESNPWVWVLEFERHE